MAKEVWVTTLGNVKLAVMATWVPLSGPALLELGKAGTSVTGVKAVDFGQGDCNAIMAQDSLGADHPVLYFDIGGGSGQCSRTHPHHPTHGTAGQRGWAHVAGRLDTTYSPTVILSHWDKDHYYSATKAVPQVRNLQWLVPRQKIGASCAKFVKGLTNIRCFPHGGASVRHKLSTKANHVDLFIEQASNLASDDRNLNGLATTLVRHDGAGTDQSKIVMPGDAPYNLLPSLAGGTAPGGTVAGLFAYHHGSQTHLNHAAAHIPAPAGGGHRILFSYGLSPTNTNNYGHPNAAAVTAYRGAHWNTRLNTASTNPNSTASTKAGHNVTTRGDRDCAV